MEKKNLPIGFMDSGLGGLSVLKEALRIMPYDDFIYYGDSRNAPYGVKDQETIRRLTFQVVEMLLDGTTETEELPLPGVDEAWQGREGDRQASPFVLVRRGDQAAYLQYDRTLALSPEDAAAALAEVLDQAAY